MNSFQVFLISIPIIVGLLLFILIFKKITHAHSRISRKMTHIFLGPVFMLTWLIYPENDPYARYYAMLFPSIVAFFLFLSYLFPKNILTRFLLETMSREGRVKELIEGPFIYGVIISLLTIVYWKENINGIVPMIILCLGDGMADVIGSRGKHVIKAPFGRKTIEGSSAFIIFSLVVCLLYEYLFFGKMWIIQTVIICCIGCITEFVSPSLLDNLLIVLVTVCSCYLFNWN